MDDAHKFTATGSNPAVAAPSNDLVTIEKLMRELEKIYLLASHIIRTEACTSR